VKIMDPSVGASVIHYVPEFEKRWNRWVRRVKPPAGGQRRNWSLSS
jgi:hypothetical protein